jgi:microcystin-dependent protein
MFSLTRRGEYSEAIESEFENLFARLRGLLSQTFDIDGELIVADPELAIVPVGGVFPFAGTAAPTGYLLCDGSQVSRTTYQSLFGVVGTTYGAGDGSTTFHLPDLRQRFPLGKAASGTGSTLGATGGAIDHTHSVGSHTHSFSATSSSDGNHSHGGSTGSNGSHSHSISSDGTHSHTGTHAEPETTGFVTVVPYSSPDGGHNHGGSTGSVGDHSHSINGDGTHSHSVSGTTGSSSAAETGTANPPFLSLNYVIFAGR